MSKPRCPRCDSENVEPCDVLVQDGPRDEWYRANFRCLEKRCAGQVPFRFTAPIPGYTGTEVIV